MDFIFILRLKRRISFRTFFVRLEILRFVQDDKLGVVGANCISCVGVGEIPLLGEMSRSDKGVMA